MSSCPTPKKTFIDYLRAIAIILVVVHHSMQFGKDYFTPSVVFETVLDFISLIHVPLFFMIAGYLCHKQPVGQYYKKKIFQILIPFLVFTLAKLLFNLFVGTYAHAETVGEEIISAFLFGEYYWFSYALFLMVLAAPLLWLIQDKKWLLWIILAVNIAVNMLAYNAVHSLQLFQIKNMILYFPWFLLGFILNRHDFIKEKNRLVPCAVAAGVSLIVLALSIFVLKKVESLGYLYTLCISISVSYLLLVLFRAIRIRLRILEPVSKYSYQIFLLDSFVKVGLFFVAKRFLPINPVVILLLAAVNIALSVAICFVASKLKFACILLGIKYQSTPKKVKQSKNEAG